MRFKIDWASLIVGKKFTVFALFCFVFEGNFQVQAPGGAYIRRGDLTEGFFALRVRGTYIWRGLYMEGLFSEFYVMIFTSRVSTRYDLPSDKAAWPILSELNMCVYTYTKMK